MKRVIMALTLTVVSAAALAGHCPRDAKAIDAALSKVTISDDIRGQVEKLKNDGMELHGNGDHANSEKTLAEAMRLLLENISADGGHMGHM